MAERADLADGPRQGDELVIVRIFDAPRDLVFKAWTDPALMRQWMGPRHHPAIVYEADSRAGGAWRGVLRGIADGQELPQGGVYKEIVANEKIVFTFAWGEAHAASGADMECDVRLSDFGAGKTKMVFRQSLLPSMAERDGHREGWSSSFGRLNELIRIDAPETIFEYPPHWPVMLTSRIFNAPRQLVWDAHTKPALMAQWWGPRKYTSTVREMDVRVGGAWRIVHTGAEGQSFEFFGAYLEVAPPSRLVWTFGFGDMEPAPEEFTFEALGDGRTRLTALSRVPSFEMRDAIVKSGMEEGARESFERLDALLATN